MKANTGEEWKEEKPTKKPHNTHTHTHNTHNTHLVEERVDDFAHKEHREDPQQVEDGIHRKAHKSSAGRTSGRSEFSFKKKRKKRY